MVKVCQLSSVHNAFDVRIFHKECNSLAKAGYEVVLIIPHDKNEESDGVKIHALPRSSNRWHRLAHLIWRMYSVALVENAQIYHLHDPELIPLGILLKIHGKKVFYDVHETYSESLLTDVRKDIPKNLRKIFSKMVKLIELMGDLCFDAILPATPAISNNFKNKNTVLIQNYPLVGELVSNAATPYKQRGNNICYTGGISEVRGIREIVRATSLLSPEYESKLYLAGKFKPNNLLEELMKLRGWERVTYWGVLSRPGVAEIMSKTKVGLVLYHPGPNHTNAQPHKFFEYMSAGLPIIASHFPHWEEIVNRFQCGIVVNPLQSEAIAEAITWIFDHPMEAEAMGRRGQKAVHELFNWQKEANKLIELYGKILL